VLKTIQILTLLLLGITSTCSAQIDSTRQLKIDSLILELSNNNDSIKTRCLNDLANQYRIVGKLYVAKNYADSGLHLAQEIKWNYGQALSHNNLSYINIYESDFEEAMKNAVAALKIGEATNDKENLGFTYLYLGFINQSLGENTEVLDYFRKSLVIRKELGNNYNLGFSYSYLGNYYSNLKNYDSSYYYHTLALEVRLKTKDTRSIADSYLLMGTSQFKLKKYDEALRNYAFALEKYELINDKRRLAETYRNYAEAYIFKDKLGIAEHYLTLSLELAEELGAIENLIPIYDELAHLQEKRGDFEQAYSYVRKHIEYKDSISSDNVYREVTRQILEHKRDKEERIKQIQYQKEKEVQKLFTTVISVGLVLVLVFLIFVFNRLRVTRKQKEQIGQQKEEIEESHKEITDSINYAKRIQSAILPTDKVIKKHLTESFVIYKPKDIVAGDFYWIESVAPPNLPQGEEQESSSKIEVNETAPFASGRVGDGLVLFAAADCTGHGVPGAMVSVVCNNALNRSVREHNLTDPGEILDQSRKIIIDEFEKSEEDVNDGMDIALCSLQQMAGGYQLKYAGANNALWIIRDGELLETKGNKQPIGKFHNPHPFTTHTMELQKGDTIYIFTDGYVDQFGGEKGKKFKAANFKKLLLSIQHEPLQKQKELIDQTFIDWKGQLEQLDDVCVIGVKI